MNLDAPQSASVPNSAHASVPTPVPSSVCVRTEDAEGTRWVAKQLAKVMVPGDLVLLVGGLGAGKTTFTQGLGEGLEVQGRVTSPTYIVSRVHEPRADGPSLVHVDAYRIEDELDLETIDLETTSPHAVTVVEWGVGKVEHLSDQWLEVHLAVDPTQTASESGEFGSGNVEGQYQAAPDFEDEDEPRLLTLRPIGPTMETRLQALAASHWLTGAEEMGVVPCSA